MSTGSRTPVGGPKVVGVSDVVVSTEVVQGVGHHAQVQDGSRAHTHLEVARPGFLAGSGGVVVVVLSAGPPLHVYITLLVVLGR